MFVVAHLNVRSILGGFDLLKDHILSHDYDAVALTETWLTPCIRSAELSIPGYNFIRADRSDGRRGGGIGIFLKVSYSCDVITLTNMASCEQLWVRLTSGHCSLAFGVIYRPPYTSCAQFISDFEDTLFDIFSKYDVICVGDFNINLLDTNNNSAVQFS